MTWNVFHAILIHCHHIKSLWFGLRQLLHCTKKYQAYWGCWRKNPKLKIWPILPPSKVPIFGFPSKLSMILVILRYSDHYNHIWLEFRVDFGPSSSYFAYFHTPLQRQGQSRLYMAPVGERLIHIENGIVLCCLWCYLWLGQFAQGNCIRPQGLSFESAWLSFWFTSVCAHAEAQILPDEFSRYTKPSVGEMGSKMKSGSFGQLKAMHDFQSNLWSGRPVSAHAGDVSGLKLINDSRGRRVLFGDSTGAPMRKI